MSYCEIFPRTHSVRDEVAAQARMRRTVRQIQALDGTWRDDIVRSINWELGLRREEWMGRKWALATLRRFGSQAL